MAFGINAQWGGHAFSAGVLGKRAR